MATQDRRTVEELLAKTAWIRRVASSLVRDESDADDVAQATWLAALQSPPASNSRLSAWLARVARNVVRKRARTDNRRARREIDAPDYREPAITPESLVERAELQQLIAAFVLDLSEPFRSTLLLHYFEELSPSEIAKREGIPAATVRSRLKRGLDELRSRLDRAHGDKRRAWLVPVAALADPRLRKLPLAWKGLFLMKTKVAIVAAVAALLALLMFVGQTVRRSSGGHGTAETGAKTTSTVRGPFRRASLWGDPQAPARSIIEGMVRGPDGKPFDGALVGAVPEDSDADELHVHASALTLSSGGGHFRITGLRAGAYAVQATAHGLSPAYRSGLVILDGDAATGIELQLHKGGVNVTAQIRDVGGGVIAGGKLHARRHGEERPDVFTGQCDSAGTCSISLAKGGYMLVAEAEGYAPAKRDIVAMADQTVQLQLQPAATLRGRVVERGSHSAVPGASVVLTMTTSLLADSQVLANDDGVFEFHDVAPGDYQLAASKGRLAGRSRSAITVAIGSYVGDATVEVEPARSIKGRVSGPNGGVGGAKVLLRPARSTGNVVGRVQSGADGLYTIEGVLPGAYQLRAESSGLAPAIRDVVVGDNDADGVDLRLEAGGEVSGTVFAKGSVPVEGAVVSASVEDGEFRTTSASARTGADGRFRLEGLGVGLLYVSAKHPVHGRSDAPPAQLAAGEKKQFTLAFDEANASVEGKVSWEDGSPAAGVSVRANPTHGDPVATQTDARGQYRLGSLVPGPFFVTATREPGPFVARDPEGRQREWITLANAEQKTGVNLVLLRGGHHISGQVVGPDGAPVSDAMVRADAEDESGESLASGDPRIAFKKAVSVADGSFRIDDLTASSFTLTASHAGFPDAVVRHLAADASGVRVQFKAEATIEGVAVTPEGKPVSEYALTLFASGPNMMLPANQLAVHDAGGAFKLKGLSAGSYDVLAATADGRTGRLSALTVGDGEHKTDVRIIVSQGTRLHGRVVEYGTGLPIPHAEVTILSVGAPVSTSTDANGAFSVDGLPGGRVAWIAAAADTRSYIYDRIRVTMPADKTIVDTGAIQLMPGDMAARGVGWTGILPTNLDGVASVETVASRSPAALAGIKPGDVIKSIGGISVDGLGFQAIYYLLAGAPGSKVMLQLASRTIELTRVPDPQ